MIGFLIGFVCGAALACSGLIGSTLTWVAYLRMTWQAWRRGAK